MLPDLIHTMGEQGMGSTSNPITADLQLPILNNKRGLQAHNERLMYQVLLRTSLYFRNIAIAG
jgi:hypothetical protein